MKKFIKKISDLKYRVVKDYSHAGMKSVSYKKGEVILIETEFQEHAKEVFDQIPEFKRLSFWEGVFLVITGTKFSD